MLVRKLGCHGDVLWFLPSAIANLYALLLRVETSRSFPRSTQRATAMGRGALVNTLCVLRN